jgi:formamidopyrimidine-DNA glycosylase
VFSAGNAVTAIPSNVCMFSITDGLTYAGFTEAYITSVWKVIINALVEHKSYLFRVEDQARNHHKARSTELQCYIPENRIPHCHNCESLIFNKNSSFTNSYFCKMTQF